MIEWYDDDQPCCRPTVKITDTGNMSTYEKLCYVIDKIKELIEFSNGWQAQLDQKEDSLNITNARKLDTSGNFTGTWFGETFLSIFSQVGLNNDLIKYLTGQFSDGQTGFVIDGGFFEETGIDRNFNGGVF